MKAVAYLSHRSMEVHVEREVEEVDSVDRMFVQELWTVEQESNKLKGTNKSIGK